MTLGQSHDTSLGNGQLLFDILSKSNRQLGYVCTLTLTSEIWPWVKVMTYLGPLTTIVYKIIQIQRAVRSYDPDTEFGFVYTMTLTLEILPWLKSNEIDTSKNAI